MIVFSGVWVYLNAFLQFLQRRIIFMASRLPPWVPHFSITSITGITLTLLHSERPKVYTILAFLSATGLTTSCLPPLPPWVPTFLQRENFNPIALRKAKIVYYFGLSECNNRVNEFLLSPLKMKPFQKGILTLKAPNKNCSRRHFNFLPLSLEGNMASFFM